MSTLNDHARSRGRRGAARTLRWVAAGLAISTLAAAAPSPQERATAQTLLDAALALMEKGKFAAACPKLEESQRIDPGQGTQFQLARCWDGLGRVASAWILYTDVAAAAKAAGKSDRERVARQRADAVAERLPRLVVEIAPGSRGAEVRRDGELIGVALYGTPFPVDPGTYTITARLDGRKPYETKVEALERKITTVTIPELAVLDGARPVAAAPPTPSAPVEPEAHAEANSSGRRTAAWVVGGAGVAALGAGVVIGLIAKSKYGDAGCSETRCDHAAYDQQKDAIKTANVGTVVGGLGLLAIVGGGVLWLTAPTSQTQVGLGPNGVSLGGKF